VTVLFSGGLIPWYMVIRLTGLIDSIWALILPGAVPIFNVILMINFFRNIPPALEEAAYMDGAGHGKVLWRIYMPLSVRSLPPCRCLSSSATGMPGLTA
jgi:putative aldouronate transport system permease protein